MKRTRPKYAFLINSLQLGGAERVVQTLVNELSGQNDVHLVTLEGNVVFALDERVTVHNLSSPDRETNKIWKVVLLFFLALRLKRYLKKNDIHVVLSNLFRANYVNILAKIIGGKHCACIADHTLPARLHKEGLPGRMNLFLIRRLYKYADASVSVSEKVQSQLLSLTTLAFNRYVINNPFDLAYIASRSEEAVDDFCYVDGEVYLVAVGRINTVKRYDLIIGAMNLLSNDRLNLIVIGEEENVKADTLLTMAVNKDKVHFLGAKENPYKYIKNSDVLILSSDSESFGNVLIESMVCGTPVIGARCGGPEEIICHDYSGILVDPGDVQQLARAIQRTAFDDEYKALLANNALSGVNKYDVHRIAGQYKKVLESCH